MRELSYEVPFKRLTKLSRSMGRKALPRMWWARWVILVLYFSALIGFIVFDKELTRLMMRLGVPSGLLPYMSFVLIGAAFALFILGFGLIRKSAAREAKARANFDLAIHLTQDDGGIHIATQNIEYYLKWSGISQLLIEPDGVVVSHGLLFWLIPDKAFASPADRLGFIRDVYGRLNDRARSISESQVRPALESDAGAKAA